MKAFEEFQFGNYVLRFYRKDYGLVCSINESMVEELHKVVKDLNERPAINKEDGLVCVKCFEGIGK